MNNLMLLGTIFSLLNYASYCLSRFVNEKYKMMIFDFIAKLFTLCSMFCFRTYSGFYSFIVTMILLLVATAKEKKEARWTPLYLVFQLLYLIIMITTFNGVSSILIFVNMTINLVSIWFLTAQQIRVTGAVNSLIYMLFQLSIKNYAGFLELAVILSNIISFTKNRNDKQLNADKTEAINEK